MRFTKRDLSNWLFIFLIIGLLLATPIIAQNIENYFTYKKSVELFENNEYDLQELIERNNLVEQKPLMSHCFDSNDKIKELANRSVLEIQKFILEFPYDEEQLNNLSTHCQKATETLKNGEGICNDKAILACSIFYEKDISCYVLSSRVPFDHSISLIYYKNGWRPIRTTGRINKENIDEFMDNLSAIYGKEILYIV